MLSLRFKGILFGFVVLLIWTCSSDDDVDISLEPVAEYVKVNINEIDQTSYAALSRKLPIGDKYYLSIYKDSPQGFLRRTLLVSEFDLETGTVRLNNYALWPDTSNYMNVSSLSTSLQDGDVVGNYYIVNTQDTFDDIFSIYSINADQRAIEGSLRASYQIFSPDSLGIIDQSFPYTDVVVEVDFRVEVER